MATVREWADAYLAQGRADLDGARAMGATAPSTLAMLIQMVFEKFAKAALLRQQSVSIDWARRSHGSTRRLKNPKALAPGTASLWLKKRR